MIRLALATLMIALAVQTQARAGDDGLQIWKKIHRVFSHPRCANRHVGDDNLPMWSGAGYGATARPHGMNINAGGDRLRDGAQYIPCTTCHGLQNSSVLHGPPGATSMAARAGRDAMVRQIQRRDLHADQGSRPQRRSLASLISPITSRRTIWSIGAGRRGRVGACAVFSGQSGRVHQAMGHGGRSLSGAIAGD